MTVKEAAKKAGAAKDSLDMKKRQADAAQQKYQLARDQAEAARQFQQTKDLEYLRGRNDATDKILAARDRANQAAGSVEQRKMELGQARDVVKKIIEQIEKSGGR
jgi:hypothetical protein